MKRNIFLFFLLSLVIMILPAHKIYAADDYGAAQEQEAEQKAGEVYDNISDKLPSAASDDAVENITGRVAGGSLQTMLKAFYSTYQAIKAMAGVILALSILAGVIILVFAKKNKKFRRVGVITFLIIIPVVLWLVVYGIGILNGKFLGATYDASKDTSGEYVAYLKLREFYNIFPNKQKFMANVLNMLSNMYSGVQTLSYVLIALSLVIGLVTFILNKYDKRQRRRALYGFGIGIPIALLIVINGVSHFNKIFM